MPNFDDLVRDRIRTDPDFAVMMCERLSRDLTSAEERLRIQAKTLKDLKTKTRSILKSISNMTREYAGHS